MNLLGGYEGFIFDLDGTIYLGETLLPGAREVVAEVRRQEKPIVYLTNKPLERPAAYAAKLTRLGISTAPDEVISSLDSLTTYMAVEHPLAKVLCITESLIAEILTTEGYQVLSLNDADQADVVVVSFDRTFDYEKLLAAFRAVNSGAVIVATNPDPSCPTPEGGLPDCAAMVAAIETSTGARAEIVLGKPSPYMARAVMDRLGVSANRTLLVGDRAGTDVAMAVAAGVEAALVLTGVTTRAEGETFEPAPKYVLEGLGELLHPLKEPRTAMR